VTHIRYLPCIWRQAAYATKQRSETRIKSTRITSSYSQVARHMAFGKIETKKSYSMSTMSFDISSFYSTPRYRKKKLSSQYKSWSATRCQNIFVGLLLFGTVHASALLLFRVKDMRQRSGHSQSRRHRCWISNRATGAEKQASWSGGFWVHSE
jgi:hypothetical protein